MTPNTALVTPGSLGCIIRTFKAAVTRELNRHADPPGGSFWQRNYYERIIRDRAELMVIRRYIRDNPKHPGTDSAAEPM